ncbi:MAG: trypsin-like peptidase domain-containing protein [Anaerolineae bacterium]|nr:trypsin-like peptidase domain-containing protein [Anaerolineae bacterium]
MSEALQTLSSAFADAVKTAGSYVVRVEARRRMPATGIVYAADGVIVTSHHVVERDDNIVIGLPDGSTVPAALVGRDPSTDLAVLRAQSSSLTPAVWTPLNEVAVGHLVLALGRPGHTVMATLGIVSALSENEWRTPMGGRVERYLQTDVLMYPGFSGGPLLGADGRVVGMNTSAVMQGVSLAIPAATIKRVADTILTHGKVRQGYLGVGAQPIRLQDSLKEKAGQDTGLMLVSIESGGPADKSGLLIGDILIAADEVNLGQMDDLLAFLAGDSAGKTASVKLLRGGELQTVSVTVGEKQ